MFLIIERQVDRVCIHGSRDGKGGRWKICPCSLTSSTPTRVIYGRLRNNSFYQRETQLSSKFSKVKTRKSSRRVSCNNYYSRFTLLHGPDLHRSDKDCSCMKLLLIQNSWSFKFIRFLSFYEYPSYSYLETFLTEFAFRYAFITNSNLIISDISFNNALFLWLLINTQSLAYSSRFFSAWLSFFICFFFSLIKEKYTIYSQGRKDCTDLIT